MVGRSSRREPRPQQQDMYNADHGGEYVQLTWLVSGEICNAVQSDGPQPLDFEYKWNWVLYVLVL